MRSEGITACGNLFQLYDPMMSCITQIFLGYRVQHTILCSSIQSNNMAVLPFGKYNNKICVCVRVPCGIWTDHILLMFLFLRRPGQWQKSKVHRDIIGEMHHRNSLHLQLLYSFPLNTWRRGNALCDWLCSSKILIPKKLIDQCDSRWHRESVNISPSNKKYFVSITMAISELHSFRVLFFSTLF